MRVLPSVAFVVLAVTLSACSGPDPAPATPSGTTSGTTAAGSTAPPAPASDPAGPTRTTTDLPAPPQREPRPAGSGPAAAPPPASSAPPAPAASAHTDPVAIDVVVNKRRPLTPLDYAPADLRRPDVATPTGFDLLRPDAAEAVEEMFAAAAADGVGLAMVSGYRSFADQESTYAYWVGQYGGPAGADTVSARPGYSEHQTGLAFDLAQADGACTLVRCFRDTPAGQWAAANAADFGFILRYPLGFHEITGFSAESWHFRYVGRDVSLAMEAAGTQTLEEHFGLPAAPSY
ncbi:D-alanyl-D-alanine carboxypeptidase family protein [Arthrobacter sp. SX1312]|uniref:M15 family metallopeptidase n=1 Tax=Arthrobacter sp. SX1312 TaxID=2058896 RepID=UPI000CE3DF92|nr:M15 family metallopeptidase [Arthrobacter sp. SX1312]